MARVPEYQRRFQLPSRVDVPESNLRFPADAFGATDLKNVDKIGQGMNDLAKTVEVLVQQRLDKRDEAWTSQAMSQLTDNYTDYVAGENGVYTKQGQDVDGITKSAKVDLQTFIDSVANNAPSRSAAERFRVRASSSRNSTLKAIAGHESKQLNKWAVSSTVENIQSQAKSIALHPYEPEEVEQLYKETVYPEIAKLGKLKGEPIEALDRKTKEVLFADIINRNLAIGDTENARMLLDRWGKDLTPDVSNRLTENVRGKEIINEANGIAENLMARKVTRTDGLNEINAIEDEKVRRKASSRFRSLWADQTYAENLKVTNNTFNAQKELDDVIANSGLAAGQSYLNSLSTDNPADMKVYKAIESRFNRIASGRGIDRTTDVETYLSISDAIDNGEITLKQEISVKANGKLSAGDMREMEAKLKGAQEITDKSLKQPFAKAIGKEHFQLLTKSQKEDWYKFSTWARDVLKGTNKANDPEHIKKLADMYVLEGEIDTPIIGYGLDRTYSQALDDPSWLPDIISDKHDDAKKGVALTQSMAANVKKELERIGRWDYWMGKAGGNAKLAVRMAWRKELDDILAGDRK